MTIKNCVKIVAPNDVNGNPRRCWIIEITQSRYVKVIDEGYSGSGALTEDGGFTQEEKEQILETAPEIHVSANEYNFWLKGRNRSKSNKRG